MREEILGVRAANTPSMKIVPRTARFLQDKISGVRASSILLILTVPLTVKNTSARTLAVPVVGTPSTPSVPPTAKDSGAGIQDAHRIARRILSTSSAHPTAKNTKVRTQGVSTRVTRTLRTPPVRDRNRSASHSTPTLQPPREPEEEEKEKRGQWRSRVQTAVTVFHTGTIPSTASTTIREMEGVGGMG